MKARTLKAIEVLKAGGYFREALETQHRGGEKFTVRLRNAEGKVVPGFGFATRQELMKAEMLEWRESARSSTWPTEHVLKKAWMPMFAKEEVPHGTEAV
jgi:hypothetical protein